jgi:hypothetical protein
MLLIYSDSEGKITVLENKTKSYLSRAGGNVVTAYLLIYWETLTVITMQFTDILSHSTLTVHNSPALTFF